MYFLKFAMPWEVSYMNTAVSTVPHLTTALSGPLRDIESHILDKQHTIESWFRNQWRQIDVPFYASVDLRNAGYKVAPVDTNLFPAGFNNLNPAFQPLCIQSMQLAIERHAPGADRIVIIPENHTRNLFYLESLHAIQSIIEKAGFMVRVGSISPEITETTTIELPSGAAVTLEPVEKTNQQVHIADFVPDLIVLNNDLSGGEPEILQDISQPMTPALNLGWATRLKSMHFKHYQSIANEFAELIDIDPWLIDPMFRNCGEIDFLKQEGTSCLIKNVEALLTSLEEKYQEYSVPCEPFVMVKADAGTYGMGVMTVHSPDDVVELNRKQRTRMATTKEGQKVTQVIIQEGVYTHETWQQDDSSAEPVVYMIDHNVVGGFYRVHAKRGANENLNSPGMRFEPLAFADCCISPDKELEPDAHPNRFYTYGVIARLALLAAGYEMRA